MALVLALAKVAIKLIVIYFHSFEIFIIQIGEMAFYKPDYIIIKSNYFRNAQKGECFLGDFEALHGRLGFPSNSRFKNHPKSIRTTAQTSISRTSASEWPATAW
jgi:hypothetical protein